MNEPRWTATVTYRSEVGLVPVEHDIAELAELHDLVEAGPDWNCITESSVKLNRRYYDVTIEEAEKL